MHIVLYASDHGYGHATRMAALAETLYLKIHSSSNSRVTLCAGAAAPLLRRSLARLHAARLAVEQVPLDFGFVPRKSSAGIDEAATATRLAEWTRRFGEHAQAEARALFRRAADLVIADAPACAVAAAALCNVPAVVCSNFNWLDVYGDRFGAEPARVLSEAYQRARLGLRLSPGRLPLCGVPRVRDLRGLLGRRPRRSRSAVRSELGVEADRPLLGIGLGRSLLPTQAAALCRDLRGRGCKVLLPADVAPPSHSAVVSFPPDDPDTQDYFGACDAVLAKGGYSTIAEAGLAGVPLLLFPADGNRESTALCQEAAAQGLGVALPDEDAARRLLRDPEQAIATARDAHRLAEPPTYAGPQVIDALKEEGLL